MRDLTSKMQRLLKSHVEANNPSVSTEILEGPTFHKVEGVVGITEPLTNDSLLAGVCNVVDVVRPPSCDSHQKTLSNLSNCQTERELALTAECQTLSNSEPSLRADPLPERAKEESRRIRSCQFVEDSHGRMERYWFCTVHRARVSDPLQPCFFSRYDGTPLESAPDRPLKVTPPFLAAEVKHG